MENPYDRAKEDLGNIVMLEHVNVEIPNQQLASEFYLMGLGLTRDPYLFPGTNNMWVNVGKSQFHLPTGDNRNTAQTNRCYQQGADQWNWNLPVANEKVVAAPKAAASASAFAKRRARRLAQQSM